MVRNELYKMRVARGREDEIGQEESGDVTSFEFGGFCGGNGAILFVALAFLIKFNTRTLNHHKIMSRQSQGAVQYKDHRSRLD